MTEKKSRLKPIQGLGSQYIVKILKKCNQKDGMTTGELLEETIKFKKTMLKYLRFMLDKKLIRYEKQQKYTVYYTTAKGNKVKELFCYSDKPLNKQRK